MLVALGPTLLHKTERRAVSLRIQDETALRAAYADFESRFGPDMTATLVQRMVPAGVEMLVGAVQDPLFGPLIACGTGGTLVDLLEDTVFRLHPLTVPDVAAMLDEVRGARLLRGFRGAAPKDRETLVDLLVRLTEVFTAYGDLIEALEINPIAVLDDGQGVRVLDALLIPKAPTDSHRPNDSTTAATGAHA